VTRAKPIFLPNDRSTQKNRSLPLVTAIFTDLTSEMFRGRANVLLGANDSFLTFVMKS